MTRVTLVADLAEISDLKDDWRRTRALGMSDIFTSPEWCQAAWRFLPELGVPRLLTVHDGGEDVRAILPLSAVGGRVVCAGSPLGDEHDIRVNGCYPEAVSSALTELKSCVGSHERVHLQDISAGGLVANTVTTHRGCPAPTLPLPDTATNADTLPVILGASRQRYRALARRRGELRRLGALTVDRVSHPVPLRDAVAGFVTDRLDAWRKRGRLHELPYADRLPCFAEFLSTAASELARKGRCFLTRLLLDERLLAQALYFRHDHSDLLYMSTYTQDYAWYSPSHLLLLDSAAMAVDEGITAIELGRGDEPYKFHLGARPRYLREFVL